MSENAKTSEVRKTITIVGVAFILAVLALVTAPANVTPDEFLDKGEAFFPTFTDPNTATSLEVIEYDQERAELRPFKVINNRGLWTIPSHHDYPADGQDRLAKTAAGVISLRKDDFRSSNVSDHEECGVLDPLDEAAPLTGRGTRITLKGANGEILADLILGKRPADRPDFRFVRMPDQKRVYLAKADLDISTRFKDWIEQDLLKVEKADIDHAVLRDYSIDERSRRLRDRGSVTLAKKDSEWSSEEVKRNEEVNTTSVDTMLTAADDLKILGVRPKPAGISARLERLETVTQADLLELQARGYYLAGDGNLYSNEGEVEVGTSKGVFYTLRFGEILYGEGEAVSAGTEASDDESAGPGENRYLFLTVEYRDILDEPKEPANRDFEGKERSEWSEQDQESKKLADAYDQWKTKVEQGKQLASELNERFAPWYYVISNEDFKKLKMQRSDLIKKKES